MKILETHNCYGGVVGVYEHESKALGCAMKFSVFVPENARDAPAMLFLSGLTCTHENFTTKAAAYKKAAAVGMVIVVPDTSPRGDDVPDDAGSYDFGKGAGFYIDATQAPWAKNFRMESYIADELYDLVQRAFPVRLGGMGICGHSMGGHGALTLYFKYPAKFISVSALSPIVAPSQVPWGEKAFSGYLGADKNEWLKHDACVLVGGAKVDRTKTILIDQGTGDQFLATQLKPELFAAACKAAGQALTLRMQEGYDHSYYFIQSLIDDHIAHHARAFI
jgi:S-formylglutathione hydrolase